MSDDDILERVRARRELPSPERRRRIREGAGLSQADLADALGVHRETIYRWEHGVREPRGQRLVRYVRLLQTIEAAS